MWKTYSPKASTVALLSTDMKVAKFINYRYKMKTNSNKLQIKTLIHKCF